MHQSAASLACTQTTADSSNSKKQFNNFTHHTVLTVIFQVNLKPSGFCFHLFQKRNVRALKELKAMTNELGKNHSQASPFLNPLPEELKAMT